jgi:predicted nucleotide-binding protein (sugar kinase/HSP70/actin superfamily)
MKLTFPYMGVSLVYKKLFRMLGHEVVMPKRPTQATLQLGTKYAPEFACIPCKAVLGTYLETLNQPVDAIVTSGGNGPCRAGLYGEVHKRILAELGYNVRFVVLNQPKAGRKTLWEDLNFLKGGYSWVYVVRILRFLYAQILVIDQFEKRLRQLMPYEKQRGACKQLWKEINQRFDHIENRKMLEEFRTWGEAALDKIEIHQIDASEQLRIGIVGEIYVVMESSINMDVEDRLASLGCETHKAFYLSNWVEEHILERIPLLPGKWLNHQFEKLAWWDTPYKQWQRLVNYYLPLKIGGHAQETIAHILDYYKQGYDGIVHLMPFSCLPELVSRSIIPSLSEDHDFPILSVSLDEHTGEANMQTRLEAFVDLVRTKKAQRSKPLLYTHPGKNSL